MKVLVGVMCILSSVCETSCIANRRIITRNGPTTVQQLLTADKNDLIKRIDHFYTSVRNFSATVDIIPALGTAEKSRITEYKDVRAYLLFRKPANLRLVALFPIVRNKAADLVSIGDNFELYLPTKNVIVKGKQDLPIPEVRETLYNLRPRQLVEALLVEPVDAKRDYVLLENLTDEDNAAYLLYVIKRTPDGELYFERSIWFDRTSLRIARQLFYGPVSGGVGASNIVSDIRYSQWQEYQGVAFPKQIVINRPRDEYSVVITVIRMEMNLGITDDKFMMSVPEGTKVRLLGQEAGKIAFGVQFDSVGWVRHHQLRLHGAQQLRDDISLRAIAADQTMLPHHEHVAEASSRILGKRRVDIGTVVVTGIGQEVVDFTVVETGKARRNINYSHMVVYLS